MPIAMGMLHTCTLLISIFKLSSNPSSLEAKYSSCLYLAIGSGTIWNAPTMLRRPPGKSAAVCAKQAVCLAGLLEDALPLEGAARRKLVWQEGRKDGEAITQAFAVTRQTNMQKIHWTFELHIASVEFLVYIWTSL
jgi:hypothetical protein